MSVIYRQVCRRPAPVFTTNFRFSPLQARILIKYPHDSGPIMRKMTMRSTNDRRFAVRFIHYLAAKPQAVRLANGLKRRRPPGLSARKIRVAVVLLVISGAGIVLINSPHTPLPLPATSAEAISNEAFRWLEQQYDVAASGPITNLVQQTGARLAAKFEHENMNWQFVMLRKSDASLFALPDGRIFLRDDTLLLVNRIDDLAALLAHQMSHVALGHIDQRITDNFDQQELEALTPAAQTWPKLIRVLNISGDDEDFSRRQERQADEHALKLMTSACFDIGRLPALWEKTHTSEDMQAEFLIAVHPHNNRSIKKIHKSISDNDLQPPADCEHQ